MMERIKLGTLARITTAPDLDSAALLNIAKERAPDPTVFDTVSPFFWQVRASSNRLDFYDTRMRPETTLKNFARAFGEGVSYQDSHIKRQNGWGQSLTGYTVETDETDPDLGDQIVEVWAELFTLPGLSLAGQSTDSFIDAVRSGIWRDVSVGFYASDIECSLCGKQSFQWWKEDGCQHIPGYSYTIKGEDHKVFAWINDGELIELSQVYKGASPAAAVIKAEQMSEAGKLSDGERAFIERRHGIRIAEPARIWTPGQSRHAEQKEQGMTQKNDQIADGTRTVIEAALKRATGLGITIPADDQPLGARVTSLIDALERTIGERDVMATDLSEERAAHETAKHEIERLKPLADDGVAYRADLISDTIAAGVRAYGTEFREEVYRGILDKLDIAGIRAMKEDFMRQGDERLTNNRITSEEEGAPAPTDRKIDPARHQA